MFKCSFFLAIALFFFTNTLNAQTQGCLYNGVLYNSSGTAIPNYVCGWKKVVNSTWTSTQQSQCASYGGISGGFNQIPCPLDDSIWFMGIGITLLGAWKLKISA